MRKALFTIAGNQSRIPIKPCIAIWGCTGRVPRMEMWEKVKQLADKTLYTLQRNKPFTIITVTSQECIIRVESTGKCRPITRQELEHASQLGPVTSLNTAMLRGSGASEYNPTYVLAILRAIS